MDTRLVAVVFTLCLLVQVMSYDMDKAQARRHLNVQRRLDRRLDNLHERINQLDEKYDEHKRELHSDQVAKRQDRRHTNSRARLEKRANNIMHREELHGMREA